MNFVRFFDVSFFLVAFAFVSCFVLFAFALLIVNTR